MPQFHRWTMEEWKKELLHPGRRRLKALTRVHFKHMKRTGGFQLFRSSGGLQALLDLLSPNVASDRDELNLTLSLLADYCTDRCGRADMRALKVVETLITILKKFSVDSTQNRASRVLANLALDPHMSIQIHQAGAIPILIRILRTSQNPNCLQTVARALRTLTVHERLDPSEAVWAVSWLLTREESEVVRAGARAILGITRRAVHNRCPSHFGNNTEFDQSMRGGTNKADGVEEGVGGLKTRALIALVNAYSQEFINIPTQKAEMIRNQMRSLIQGLESCLRETGESSMQAALPHIRTLCLSCNNSNNRNRIREIGGLEMLLRLLNEPGFQAVHLNIMQAFLKFYCNQAALKQLQDSRMVSVLLSKLVSNLLHHTRQPLLPIEKENLNPLTSFNLPDMVSPAPQAGRPLPHKEPSGSEADILQFLDWFYYTCDSSSVLGSKTTLFGLLDYVSLSPQPNTKVGQLLTHMVGNPNYLEAFVNSHAVSHLHLLLVRGLSVEELGMWGAQGADDGPPASNRIAGRSTRDTQIGVQLLNKLSAQAESDFGIGILTHCLLSKSEAVRLAGAVACPLLCTKSLCRKLSIKYDFLKLLLDCLLGSTRPLLFLHVINSLSALTSAARQPSLSPRGERGQDVVSESCWHLTARGDVSFRFDCGSLVHGDHSLLSSSSEYFRALLRDGFEESGLVSIEGVSLEVFELCIHHLHGCFLPRCPILRRLRTQTGPCLEDSLLGKDLSAARYFGLRSLQASLETQASLELSLAPSSLPAVYRFARWHYCISLARDCIRLLLSSELEVAERARGIWQLRGKVEVREDMLAVLKEEV